MTRGFTGLILAGISIIGLLAVAIAAVFISLPDVREMKKCMTTELYHVRLCETDPDFVGLNQVSPYILGAIIMSEDASFYSHSGVDLNEMKQSLIKDMEEMRYARGASTLTQQLAKNVFLSKEKSLFRKGEEIYLALQIEKYFSKGKILDYYLNIVEFGPDIYGIKKATEYYFGKPPIEVTPEEAAFLAFLLPNPKKYHQSFAKKSLTPFAGKMVKTILHRMFISHRLSDVEYNASLQRMSDMWGVPKSVQPEPDMQAVHPEDERFNDGSDDDGPPPRVFGGPLPSPNKQGVPVEGDRTLPRHRGNVDHTLDMTDQPSSDESNQDDNEFKYDFNPDADTNKDTDSK